MKNNKTILTKITRPKMAGILKRKIAFSALQNSCKRPVTWVSAPAGSGKTSLVASYLESRNTPCLWYHIDNADADIASFFYYMGIAAKQAMPKSKKSLPLFTNECLAGLSVFAQRYFEELYGSLSRPFTIVFDDYQNVPPQSEFHAIMAGGLSIIPDGINVIIVSRSDPHPAFIKLRASEMISRLGWNDLCFSEEEIREIVEMKDGRKISDAMIALLHKKTQGWVAGLLLLIESVKQERCDYQLVESLTPDEIYQYFATELFEKREASLQEFLLKTSFFACMTGKLAEALTGNKSAGRILSEFNANNYFTERRLEKDPVYVYHPLFREFLLSKAREVFTKEQFSRIQRNAAQLLAESGLFEEAAALFRASENWDALVELVIRHAESLAMQGRLSTLAEWIESLPKQLARSHPWLLYWRGVTLYGRNNAETYTFFKAAFEIFEAKGDVAGTLLAWGGAVHSCLLDFHDLKTLDSWIQWLDKRIAVGISYPSPVVEARVAAAMVSVSAWIMPARSDMKKWMERCLLLAANLPDHESLRAYTNCVVYYNWRGELDQSRLIIEKMKKMLTSSEPTPFRRIAVNVAKTMLYNPFPEHTAEVSRLVEESLKIAGENGIHALDMHIYGQAIVGAYNEANTTKARQILARMQESPTGASKVNASIYFCALTWLHLIEGDGAKALAAAERAAQLSEDAGARNFEIIAGIARAHAFERNKSHQEALACLAAIKEKIVATKSPYFTYVAGLTEAYFAFAREDKAAGLDVLQKAMALGKQYGFVTLMYFWLPDVMTFLCTQALQHNIEIEYTRTLIRKLNLGPEAASIGMERWSRPVRIYSFGNFELFLHEKPLNLFTGKVQKKPLAMLKALICLGGRNVNQQQIINFLWPDAEGDSGRSSFKVTLRRLRALIGSDDAVLFNDGRLSLNPCCCWVDLWAFESLLDNADMIECSVACEQLEQALRLYRGHFLEGEDEELYAISPCERLKSKFIGAVLTLGEFRQRTGERRSALAWYRKAIELDPLAEEVYQQQMLCLLADGNRSEALKAYESCRKNLSLRLNIEPSEKTKAIYATVTAV